MVSRTFANQYPAICNHAALAGRIDALSTDTAADADRFLTELEAFAALDAADPFAWATRKAAVDDRLSTSSSLTGPQYHALKALHDDPAHPWTDATKTAAMTRVVHASAASLLSNRTAVGAGCFAVWDHCESNQTRVNLNQHGNGALPGDIQSGWAVWRDVMAATGDICAAESTLDIWARSTPGVHAPGRLSARTYEAMLREFRAGHAGWSIIDFGRDDVPIERAEWFFAAVACGNAATGPARTIACWPRIVAEAVHAIVPFDVADQVDVDEEVPWDQIAVAAHLDWDLGTLEARLAAAHVVAA